jgi:hypothetical protein
MTKTHIFLYKYPQVLHQLKDTDNPHGDQNFLYSFPMLVLTSKEFTIIINKPTRSMLEGLTAITTKPSNNIG